WGMSSSTPIMIIGTPMNAIRSSSAIRITLRMTSPAPASVTSTLACAVSSGLRVRSGGVCDRRRDDDAFGGRRPTEQRVDLRTIDRLALEEEIDEPVQLVPMRLQQIRR